MPSFTYPVMTGVEVLTIVVVDAAIVFSTQLPPLTLSVYEKYALPLAKRIQTMHSTDPYLHVYAVDDEFMILKKLKRNDEALKVLEAYIANNPNDPIILFDLGKMKISAKDNKAGFAYLNKAKLHFNSAFTKQIFMEQLNSPDLDPVRNMPEFKKLTE